MNTRKDRGLSDSFVQTEVHPMKRSLDLARKLLLDIENRGSNCSVSVLRTGPDNSAEERVRYHLQLLIDAGLLSEVDRTSAGIPCVRLTHEGHELLELTRSESLWQEAKWICQERLGGLSLTMIRQLLLRMTLGGSPGYATPRRTYVSRRPRVENESYRVEPLRSIHRLDDRDGVEERRVSYVRVRPESAVSKDRILRYGLDWEDESQLDSSLDSIFPAHLI